MGPVVNLSQSSGSVRSSGATAKWADPVEFTNRNTYQEGKFWLGRSHVEGTPIGYGDDRHIMLTSSNRSGKGTSIIINNLCLWPGSIIVLDPKGENACVTAARRGEGSDYSEGMGQKVYVLDPFGAATTVDKKYRACFNPLAEIDPNSPTCIDHVKKIVESLIVIPPDAKDPFWQNSARDMLRGLVLHVLSDPSFEGRRNLVTVRKLILNGDKDTIELLKSMGEKDLLTAQEMLWTGMARNQSFNGVVSGIGENYQSMVINSFKTFKGIHLTLSNETEFLDSPLMAETLSRSDFKLSDLKTDPNGISVYLCLPQGSMETHFRWMRTILTLTVNEVEATQGKPASGHQVLMMADEFASLQYMPVIEKAVGYIAGLGLKFFFVLQSLEQLKSIYEKTWQTFMANCGLKLFFSLEDSFSTDHVSKMFGDTEVRSQTSSSSHTINTADTETTGTQHSKTTGKGESHSAASSDMTGSSEQESESFGTNSSHTKNETWNEQKGSSGSSGKSKGRVYNTGFIGAAEFTRNLMPFRTDRQGNRGQQWNSGWSKSASRGGGKSTTEGSNQQKTKGRSSQESHTNTETNTTSSNSSETHGEQRSNAHTEGKSDQTSIQETLNYRPLISSDEIRRFLGRIDDKESDLYPGLCLVVIAGQDPFVLRKSNYFEDTFFECFYEAHPDHPNNSPEPKTRDYFLPLVDYPIIKNFPAVDNSKVRIRWRGPKGNFFNKGDLIATVGPFTYTPNDQTILAESLLSEEAIPVEARTGQRFHNIYAPTTGRLERIFDVQEIIQSRNIGLFKGTRRWRYTLPEINVYDPNEVAKTHLQGIADQIESWNEEEKNRLEQERRRREEEEIRRLTVAGEGAIINPQIPENAVLKQIVFHLQNGASIKTNDKIATCEIEILELALGDVLCTPKTFKLDVFSPVTGTLKMKGEHFQIEHNSYTAPYNAEYRISNRQIDNVAKTNDEIIKHFKENHMLFRMSFFMRRFTYRHRMRCTCAADNKYYKGQGTLVHGGEVIGRIGLLDSTPHFQPIKAPCKGYYYAYEIRDDLPRQKLPDCLEAIIKAKSVGIDHRIDNIFLFIPINKVPELSVGYFEQVFDTFIQPSKKNLAYRKFALTRSYMKEHSDNACDPCVIKHEERAFEWHPDYMENYAPGFEEWQWD